MRVGTDFFPEAFVRFCMSKMFPNGGCFRESVGNVNRGAFTQKYHKKKILNQ